MMTDWFEWKNMRCTEYGIHVQQHPSITLPAERATFVNIPGRNGYVTVLEKNSIFTDDFVYEDMVMSVECFVTDLSRLNEIAVYLHGSGFVKFANRPNGYYEARIVNQIVFEQVMRARPHHTFVVNFMCKPFFIPDPYRDFTQTFTESGFQLTNPFQIPAEPYIVIYGHGPCTFYIDKGGSVVPEQKVQLEIPRDYIILDTPRRYVGEYLNGPPAPQDNNLADCMEGEFPLLHRSNNHISWEGNVTKVSIKPNWHTL